MKNFLTQLALAIVLVFAGSLAAQTVVVNDITANTTWTTAGSPYILDGYIFVRDGATLTIDAGVVVRGLDDDSTNNILPGGTNLGAITNPEENVGALIVTRTGKIDAQGTAASPIIFTAVKDDLTSATDLVCGNFGLWGGLIILGNATVSSPSANFNATEGFVENPIEGVITTNPLTASFALFGGDNDSDSSGVLKYVSIRHGGDVLADGDEINGLTLGGVGRNTVIDFVEVIANADDGIEWFGGTVDVKHAIVSCVVDDSYDYDQGFRGRGQYWVQIGTGNRGGEHDGGDKPDDASPVASPVVFNATYVGKDVVAGEQEMIVLRDNAGGNYKNSIFKTSQQGIELEYRYDISSSYFQLSNVVNDPVLGTIQALDFQGNCFDDINGAQFFLNEQSGGFTGSTQQLRAISNATSTTNGLINANTVVTGDAIATPTRATINSLSVPQDLDLRVNTANCANGATPPNDGFFDQVTYKGAVAPNAPTAAGWAEGWTAADEYNILD